METYGKTKQAHRLSPVGLDTLKALCVALPIAVLVAILLNETH